MFKKCLITSIALHIFLILGAGLNSPQPSVKQKPQVFQLMTASMSGTSETPEQTGESQLVSARKTKPVKRESFEKSNNAMKVSEPVSLEQNQKEATVDNGQIQAWNSGIEHEKMADGKQLNEMISDSSIPVNGELNSEGYGSGGGIHDSNGGMGNPQGNSVKAPLRRYALKAYYPQSAQERGWQGKVTLEAALGKDGRVGKITLIQSSGYPLLDDEAMKAVIKWRYHPATQDGKPIEWRIRIYYVFRLED